MTELGGVNPVVSELDCRTIFRGNLKGAVCTNDYGFVLGGEHIDQADARIEIDAPFFLVGADAEEKWLDQDELRGNFRSEAVEDYPVVRFIAIQRGELSTLIASPCVVDTDEHRDNVWLQSDAV